MSKEMSKNDSEKLTEALTILRLKGEVEEEFRKDVKKRLDELPQRFVTHEEFRPVKDGLSSVETQFQKLSDELSKVVIKVSLIVGILVTVGSFILQNLFSNFI